MKKITIFIAMLFLLCTAILFSACNDRTDDPSKTCEHTPGEWTVKTEPACNMPGMRVKLCTKCGYEISSEPIDTIAHIEGEWQIISEASCVKKGEKITECTACGEIVQTAEIEMPAHTEGTWQIASETSCTQEGERITSCTVCGAMIKNETIPKSDHTESGWIVDKAADIGIVGQKHIKCIDCDTVLKTEDIPALSEDDTHTCTAPEAWATVKAPTCTEKGERAKFCTVCGKKLNSETVKENGHTSGELVVTKIPTCTEDGEAVSYCTACKAAVEIQKLDRTGHTESNWMIDTDAEVGIIGKKHTECTACRTIIREEDIPALEAPHEHSFTEWKTIEEPSCSEFGKATRNCSECGTVEEMSLDKLSHLLPIFITGRPATESSEGLTDGWRCAACGNTIIAQRPIEKLPISSQSVDALTDVRYEGYGTGKLIFTWALATEYTGSISRIMVTVSYNGVSETYKIAQGESTWEYNIFGETGKYKFTFTPITNDNVKLNSLQKECVWMPEVSQLNFPRIEITTLDGELPTCDFVSPPAGCWGGGTINNEYVNSIINLYSGTDQLLYSSNGSGFNGAKIRIRGNTSARGDKQPFKIKLTQKYDLLSGLVDRAEGIDYSDKNWLLMKGGANLNIAVGSTVSSVVGEKWTPAYTYVALIVNGDYRGLYVLMENVKDGEARIDIKKTGYIVEMDAYWWNEDFYFTTPISEKHPAKFTFKYPDPALLTDESPEVIYIKNYITNVENKLIAGENVADVMDLESFAKWMLSHDILASYDSGGSNMYMYKVNNKNTTRLTMGPVWDYDSIYWSAEKWKIDTFARIRGNSHFYMPHLFKNEDFCTIYKDLYTEARGKIVSAVSATIDKYNTKEYARLLELEKSRWGSGYTNVETHKTDVLNWLEAHLAWMDENVK